MTEAQLQRAVIEMAQLLSWRVAHFRPARTAHGYRTPVEADGAGFPDLVMVRAGHLIFAELKSDRGRVSPTQREWIEDLLVVSVAEDRVTIYLWTPEEWLSGAVERALRATGAPVVRRAA